MKTSGPLLLLMIVTAINISVTRSQKPQLGGSVTMLNRYGLLGKKMRVMPMNDYTRWFFREESINILKNPAPIPKIVRTKDFPVLFTGTIQLELCDSVEGLLKAFFREFSFEGIEKSWHALYADWSEAAIASRFGINATYVTKGYSFILLKYARFRDSQTLAASPQNVEPTDAMAEDINRLNYDDESELVNFLMKYGSHYIRSYTTGNALYQVFVYVSNYFEFLKDEIKIRGLFNIPLLELSYIFSPANAIQVGSVQSTSRNHSLDNWIATELRGRHTEYAYTSLMKLHRNPLLLEKLNNVLQDEALIRLELRSIAPLFKNSEKRASFENYIANYIKKFESKS